MKTTKFRLFKRGDDGREVNAATVGFKDRPYYFRFRHRGRVYVRSLETADAGAAQRRAKALYTEIITAVSQEDYTRLDATKLRAEASATLDQLAAAYRTGPAEANARTRELNIHALRQIAGPNVNTLRQLSPTLARQWFETVQRAVLNEPDQELAASLKRSANSRWIQARSLFTDRCLLYYQDQGLIATATALVEFVRAGNAAAFNRIPKQNYNPPSEAILRSTLTQWEALEDRDLFLAIGHELAFGLRLAEMAQARWHWHTVRNGYPILDGRARVKNGSGLVQVRALDPFYSILKHRAIVRHWWPEQLLDEPIITGSHTFCTDGLFRAVSDWLRKLGWATMKTNHALRAYAGSQVAMRYGIYEAQMFLRHSTVKVTEQNYSHFVSKFKPQDLDSIPARWAMVAGQVTSAGADAHLDVTQDFRQTSLDSSRIFSVKPEMTLTED